MAKILVVEDNALNIKLFCDLLTAHGHEAEAVTDSREALDAARAFKPDLVITDLGMPEVSGWDVATGVKALSPKTSVILMTGWGITLDKDRARERGVDVILSKPFQISEIQKVLNEMLDQRYTVASI